MKNKNKAYVIRVFIENRILLFINFFVLCFICGLELEKYQEANISVWGYIIAILTNHYYILYCVLPVLLVVITKYVKGIQDIEKIRYKNSFQQIQESTKRFSSWIFLYLIVHLVTAMLIGLIKFKFFFEREIINVATYDELIILLNKYITFFGNPILAIISIIAYMIFGFTVLISLLSYINNRYGYNKMIIVSIVIYVLTFIGFKTDIKTQIPIVCFNNYILLHHALFVNHWTKFILLLLTGILIILFCFGKRIKMKHISFDEFILTRKEILISILLPIAIILLEVLRNTGTEGFDLKNVIASVFIGTSMQSSSFISWLGLTIIYMTPLFLIGVSDSRLARYSQLPLIIRFRSKEDYRYKVEKKYMKYIILYLLVIVVIGNVFSYLSYETINGVDGLFEMFGIEFSNKLLNVYFMLFGLYLLFDFVLFRTLSRFAGNIVGLITLLLCKFILFLLPNMNLLYFNFGIINLYENVGIREQLGFKIVFLFMLVILYLTLIYIRRVKNANN